MYVIRNRNIGFSFIKQFRLLWLITNTFKSTPWDTCHGSHFNVKFGFQAMHQCDQWFRYNSWKFILHSCLIWLDWVIRIRKCHIHLRYDGYLHFWHIYPISILRINYFGYTFSQFTSLWSTIPSYLKWQAFNII